MNLRARAVWHAFVMRQFDAYSMHWYGHWIDRTTTSYFHQWICQLAKLFNMIIKKNRFLLVNNSIFMNCECTNVAKIDSGYDRLIVDSVCDELELTIGERAVIQW